MSARDGADGGTGSARRRRERRLRLWLTHEQQSFAAVLATVTHHSFDEVGTASGVLRNQKTATRTGKGEEYVTHYTAKFRKTPFQRADAETQTEEHTVQVVYPQEHNSERIMEQTVDAPVSQATKGTVEFDCVAPALAVARKRRTGKSVAGATPLLPASLPM